MVAKVCITTPNVWFWMNVFAYDYSTIYIYILWAFIIIFSTWFADINECKDPTLNNCTKAGHCVNTQGNYTCRCPKWQRGDGRKDGEGCVADPFLELKIAIGKYIYGNLLSNAWLAWRIFLSYNLCRFLLRDVEFWVNWKLYFGGLEMFRFCTLKFQNLGLTLEVLFHLH